jgi:hypothetical protein
MPTTYILLADTTLGSSGTITFSSISQAYQDLVVRIFVAGAGSTNDFTPGWGLGGNFNQIYFRANQSGTAAGGPSTGTVIFNQAGMPQSSDTNAWAWSEIYIPNYASTTYGKIWHTKGGWNNVGTGSRYGETFTGNLTSLTSQAVTQVTLQGDGASNLRAGTRATLYGIAK